MSKERGPYTEYRALEQTLRKQLIISAFEKSKFDIICWLVLRKSPKVTHFPVPSLTCPRMEMQRLEEVSALLWHPFEQRELSQDTDGLSSISGSSSKVKIQTIPFPFIRLPCTLQCGGRRLGLPLRHPWCANYLGALFTHYSGISLQWDSQGYSLQSHRKKVKGGSLNNNVGVFQ